MAIFFGMKIVVRELLVLFPPLGIDGKINCLFSPTLRCILLTNVATHYENNGITQLFHFWKTSVFYLAQILTLVLISAIV